MRRTLARRSMRCCRPASIEKTSIFCTAKPTSIASIPQARNTGFSRSFSGRSSNRQPGRGVQASPPPCRRCTCGAFRDHGLAKERDQRTRAADILNAHGAEFVGFYGRWAWQELTSDVRASRAGAGADDQVAARPEEIPSLFAEAWNRRNPDALASLFEDDAEFVNVTGLWWHDRPSIREAHAYGLERIFNESKLAIEETRCKRLSDDVVVVHAR